MLRLLIVFELNIFSAIIKNFYKQFCYKEKNLDLRLKEKLLQNYFLGDFCHFWVLAIVLGKQFLSVK